MTEIDQAETAEEIATVRDLFREYQTDLGVDLCFQGFAGELASLPGDYSPPRGRLLLARVDDNIAGCIAMRPVSDETCEMKRLFVRESFRSAGVGRQLVERIITEAREAGYRQIYLDTLPVMAEAQRLYERLGFADIPPYRSNPVAGARFLGLQLQPPEHQQGPSR